jgi:hypothetical protein
MFAGAGLQPVTISTLFAMFAQRHVERQINLVLRTKNEL